MPAEKPKGNIYDRIFRENAKHLFIPLIKKLFNLKIEKYTVLDPNFPSTSENEVDFLYELLLKGGSEQILHIEFQSTDDPKMLARMQEYHAKIYRKYKKPIKPLVINLSKKAFTTRHHLYENEIFSGYEIVNLFDLSTDDLLSSQIPEVIILAVLSNYPKAQLETTLRNIVTKLKQLVSAEKDLNRYVNQLFFLSRLRKFEKEIKHTLDNMLIEVDIEQDYFYLQGVEIGHNKGKEEGHEEGHEKGKEEGLDLSLKVIALHKKGKSPKIIAEKLNIDLQKVLAIIKAFTET